MKEKIQDLKKEINYYNSQIEYFTNKINLFRNEIHRYEEIRDARIYDLRKLEKEVEE